MKKPLHIIYIPGLGDARVGGQRRAVSTWRWYGVEAELFQIKWADGETWPGKFERLLARIDEVAASGKKVALVGASAGASAAINAFAARKEVIVGVVCIAGKVNRPETIGRHYTDKNPAFKPSVEACVTALANLAKADRQRILSRFAILDNVLRTADSRIPEAHNSFVPIIGHIPMIATQITLGTPSFVRFLKHQAAIIK